MTYNYGPPPPPPPAPPSSSPAGYPSYGPPRGGHSGRGRGGSDRGGFHQPPASYNYGQQPPQYGPQNPAPYSGGPHPPQSGYPQPPQQQWHPDHGQQHPPPPNQHAPLPAQNYHPNYAPQVYQQAAPYNGQPQYPHAPPQPYGQGYPAPVPQPGPPAQQWGNHPPPPSNTGPYSGGGGGRGGRGGYNSRGGPKGQMMGPPIRIGFDGPPHNPPAPVSASYPPQPYGAPQGPPAPYSAPYPVYPPPAPYMPAPAPAPYEGRSGHNPRHHNRGGFHNNSMSRSHLGGDKNRHRNQHKGPIAQTPPTQHQKPDAASAGKKKKRKTNTLGLTPGDESEEDIENEEERLNEMYGAEAPNPKTSADIAAWIAERRANFPTKAKIEAKKAASKAQNGDSAKDRALEQRAEKLRKQLKKVESSIKRKREQQDEGDDMRELHLSSSPSSDTKSDDEKPEVMSTRQDTSNPGLPPPPKRADPTKHCKYYSTGGTCGKRGKCRFVHDASVREAALKERELNGGRMTLQQRLTLNDKEQEDLTIVQTLKYLQDKGCLGKSTQTTAASNAQDESNPALKTEPKTELPTLPKKQPNNSLPPIPPPSIVSSGSGGKYAGWNMNGFGNHNRSNDH